MRQQKSIFLFLLCSLFAGCSFLAKESANDKTRVPASDGKGRGYDIVMSGEIGDNAVGFRNQDFELKGSFAIVQRPGGHEEISGFGYKLTLKPSENYPTGYIARTAPVGEGWTRSRNDFFDLIFEFGPEFIASESSSGSVFKPGEQIRLILYPYCTDASFTHCEPGILSGGIDVVSQKKYRIRNAKVKITPID